MLSVATLLFRPALPLWIIIVLMICFGALSWFTYLQCAADRRIRWGLWGMRMAAMLLLVWFLLQPEQRSTYSEEEPSIVAVAVDVSASMTETPSDDTVSRAQRVQQYLASSQFQDWAAGYQHVFFEVGGDTRERSQTSMEELTFNAPRSNISAGLNTIARRFQAANVAGIVLLSDGLDHAGEALAPATRAMPIFALELEREFERAETVVQDAYIDEVSYPKTTIVNWEATVDVLVRRTATGPRSFPVHLFREGERVRTTTATFRDDETFKRLSFTIKPNRTGRLYYYVELDVRDDQLENNLRPFIIDVTDPENRILYLEGLPRWEFKFLKRALLSESMFRLSAFVQATAGAFISFERDNAISRLELPALEHAELSKYKVIVLGNLPAAALQAENYRSIRDFVDSGGGLLLMGGAEAFGTAGWRDAPFLQDMLPVTFEPGSEFVEGHFPVDLTDVGRTHPALRQLPYQPQGLPPILSLWRPTRVGDFGSTIVATPDGAPVVVTRRYGQGRVAIILTDSLWRWQLSGETAVAEKSLYSSFVTQIVHWLAPGKRELEQGRLLQVVTLKSEFELRERITVGAVYRQDTQGGLTCNIVTPDGKSLAFPMRAAELGEDVGLNDTTAGFACQFTPQTAGKYTISVVNASGTAKAEDKILVKEADREVTGNPIDRRFLKRIAAETDGRFAAWDERYEVLKQIPNEPTTIEIVEEVPIWNRSSLYLLLVALFVGEWWLRRRHDLV